MFGVFALTMGFAVTALGTLVSGAATGTPDPQVVPGLNTILLIALGIVQNRHYRKSADAEYRAFLVERRLRKIERKLGMGRRVEDDHRDTDDFPDSDDN
jgi:hypothetical protein